MTDEENWKERYLEFQRLQEQTQKLNEHLEAVHGQMGELDISINAVKELHKTEVGREVVVPIANGIFFKAEIKDNDTFIVNVGSDTTVERSADEIVGLLEMQQSKLTERLLEAETLMESMQKKMMAIYETVKDKE